MTIRTCVACGLVLAACGRDPEPVREPVPMPDPSPIEYPVALWDRKVQGETEVMVHVNEFGDVDSALVSDPSGFAEFDSAAVAGARRLRFTPGKRGDRFVPMWTRVPVRFSQDSAVAPRPAARPGGDGE
ncbi:MAG: energy transducer TonB [Gemmatimonadota bacterium]